MLLDRHRRVDRGQQGAGVRAALAATRRPPTARRWNDANVLALSLRDDVRGRARRRSSTPGSRARPRRRPTTARTSSTSTRSRLMALDDAFAELSESVWALGAVCAALDTGLAAALAEPAGVPELARRQGPASARRCSGAAAGRARGALKLAARRRVVDGRGASRRPRPTSGSCAPTRATRCSRRGKLAARPPAGRLEAGWSHTDPQILETQGVMSAAAVEPLARFVFPSLEGLPRSWRRRARRSSTSAPAGRGGRPR